MPGPLAADGCAVPSLAEPRCGPVVALAECLASLGRFDFQASARGSSGSHLTLLARRALRRLRRAAAASRTTNPAVAGSALAGADFFVGFLRVFASGIHPLFDFNRSTFSANDVTAPFVMATTYIPTTDAGFSAWLLNFATLIAADPTDYGLVAGDATAISAQNTAFQASYALAIDPSTRTAPTIAAKDAAKASALAVVRPYAMTINANAAVTNEQRGDLGLTIRKTTPTPIPAPTAIVGLALVLLTPLTARIRTFNVETPTSKAKPYGAAMIEIFVAIGTTPAIDPAQASFVNAFSKSPLTLSFTSEQVGKVATVYARYATKGSYAGPSLKGPWSASLTFNVA